MIDDPRVVRALHASALIGSVATAFHALWRSLATSQTAAAVTRAAGAWAARPRSAQRRAAGIALVTAGAVNLALAPLGEPPAGWLWMAPPAIVMSIGVLFMLSTTAAAD